MSRKSRKRFLVRIGVGALVLICGIAATVYIVTYTGANHSPDIGKKHAMIRLEDVGPGGDYASPEGLGKLRAVLEYLEDEHVPFQVAVIPRRMSLEPGGSWKEEGLDDPQPDATVRSFTAILQEAERRGGVLGMHGYTHQYGDSAQPGDGQNSGTGAEFHVKGAPETNGTAYAAERIEDSLAAFAKAGLHPGFWESPHYKDTREQEQVFRSFIGILYQPDLFSLRSFWDLNAYDNRNTYGQSSLGSVYVPAPLRYVSGPASVDKMLGKAAKGNGLASLYFHPFLEFASLEPVIGTDGQPVVRDGLPVYQYKAGEADKSELHQLVNGMRQEGYRWTSLYDIVPFTPAHQVTLPLGTKPADILSGDVYGRGHADVVVREAHRVVVIPGTYTWPRNRPQQAAEVWLKETFPRDAQPLLVDLNGDGKDDLLVYNRQTGEVRAGFAADGRFLSTAPYGTLPPGLDTLQPCRYGGAIGLLAKQGDRLLTVRSEGGKLAVSGEGTPVSGQAVPYTGAFTGNRANDDVVLTSADKPGSAVLLASRGDGTFAPPVPLPGLALKAGEQLLAGDANGDGLTDLITYAPATGVWQEYQNIGGNAGFRALDNAFGPWAQGRTRVGFTADFDGNGKADIASYDEKGRVLDLALSFRGTAP